MRLSSFGALAVFLTLAPWAQPPASGDPLRLQEHAAPGVSSESPGESAAEPIAPPPFRIVGIVVAPPTKAAVIAILNEQGREVRFTTGIEGETIGGYSIAEIRTDEVWFERGGETFRIRIGYDRARSLSPSPLPHSQGADDPASQLTEEEKQKVQGLLQKSLQRALDEDEVLRGALVEAIRRQLEKGRRTGE